MRTPLEDCSSAKQIDQHPVLGGPRRVLEKSTASFTVEDWMNHRNFHKPVYVSPTDQTLTTVASLYDAFDFLEAWPNERRGVIFETALRACCAAHDGHLSIEAARRAFEGFAKSARILAEDPIVEPWMIRSGSARGGVPM